MGYKLSVLIPCHGSHYNKCVLIPTSKDVQVIVLPNKGELTKGEYRNQLLDAAQGEYLSFVDADDRVSLDYIETLLTGISTGPDCISLRGEFIHNGTPSGLFEHSMKYSKWETTDGPITYLRMPNHLNCIKSSIAKQIRFPHINHGEDHEYSKLLLPLLKTEYYTDKILYHYDYWDK